MCVLIHDQNLVNPDMGIMLHTKYPNPRREYGLSYTETEGCGAHETFYPGGIQEHGFEHPELMPALHASGFPLQYLQCGRNKTGTTTMEPTNSSRQPI